MSKGLKVGSFITGASQECILNSISELRGLVGTRNKSSASEKSFVIRKISSDIYSSLKVKERVCINDVYEQICKLIQVYKNNNRDLINILARVLEVYYGCKDEESIEDALLELSEDIFYYIT